MTDQGWADRVISAKYVPATNNYDLTARVSTEFVVKGQASGFSDRECRGLFGHTIPLTTNFDNCLPVLPS